MADHCLLCLTECCMATLTLMPHLFSIVAAPIYSLIRSMPRDTSMRFMRRVARI